MTRWAALIGSSKALLVNQNSLQPWKVLKTFQGSYAARIGHTAKEILRAPEFSGDVLAVVTNAVYLTTREGEIFWLGQPHLSAHPRALLAPYDSNAMRVGMNVRVANEQLLIGDVAIDLCDVDEWQPPTIAQPVSLEIIQSRVHEAQLVIPRSGVCDEAIPNLLAGDCFASISRYDMTELALACRNLIGLGAGLTPAGDDFVGGVLFAAHYVRKTAPGTFHWDDQPIDALLEYARTQTNRISFAILRDLVRGHGSEPLHDFIVALLSDKSADTIQSSAARVLAIGHSTGREMSNGVLTGIELLMNNRSN